ncbi:hypothetical protein EAF00_006600 [Botryotinia globosa]|nr:hypothetical protein EAF00_006600 [Botryotinia globosa]
MSVTTTASKCECSRIISLLDRQSFKKRALMFTTSNYCLPNDRILTTPPLEIHIQGTSQVQLPAERGNLVVAVTSEGTSQTSVFEAVTQASNNLQALFKQSSTKPSHSSNSPKVASQEPPVTSYSMANLRTRSWQPPKCEDAS